MKRYLKTVFVFTIALASVYTLGDPDRAWAAKPFIYLDNYGAVNHTYDPNAGMAYAIESDLSLYAQVVDYDGIDASSHSITVTAPDGTSYALTYDSANSEPTRARYYYSGSPLMPLNGEYEVTVTDNIDNIQAKTVDTLNINSLAIVSGVEVVDNSTTPEFSWNRLTGANTYEVMICNDYNCQNVIYSGDVEEQAGDADPQDPKIHYQIPPGILGAESYYYFKIEARDAHSGLDIDNESEWSGDNTMYNDFYTGLGPSVDIFVVPAEIGITTLNSEEKGIQLYANVSVSDAQGRNNIASVKGVHPNTSRMSLKFDGKSEDSTDYMGYYQAYIDDQAVQEGNYWIEVTRQNGSIFSSDSEFLSVNPIGYPAASSISPVSGTVVNGTAVEFDWADVSGAVLYVLQIFDRDYNMACEFETEQSRFSLAAGALEENLLYRFRIITLREYPDQNIDNASFSSVSLNKMPIIVTTSEGTGKESVPDTNVAIEASTDPNQFRMVSFVQWPDSPSSIDVFSDEMGGAYDPNNFKIGSYEPSQGGYVEVSDSLKVEPGRAYWMLARNGLNVQVDGQNVFTTMDYDVPLRYASGNGWNMVGPPNGNSYYWGDLEVVAYDEFGELLPGMPVMIRDLQEGNAYLDIRIWDYNSGSYTSHTAATSFLLEKYNGYWVKAKKENVFLRFPHIAQVAALRHSTSWTAGIKDWAKRWLWVVPEAVAAGDSPPAPLGGFGGTSSASAQGGGCFISTAVYGSNMTPHVKLLREFRDRCLLESDAGRILVKAYYRYSPPAADFIAGKTALKKVIRVSLLPLVGFGWLALKMGMVSTLMMMTLLMGSGYLFYRRMRISAGR